MSWWYDADTSNVPQLTTSPVTILIRGFQKYVRYWVKFAESSVGNFLQAFFVCKWVTTVHVWFYQGNFSCGLITSYANASTILIHKPYIFYYDKLRHAGRCVTLRPANLITSAHWTPQPVWSQQSALEVHSAFCQNSLKRYWKRSWKVQIT
jgi:hypothetical protein